MADDPLMKYYNRNNNPTTGDQIAYAPAVAGVSAAGAARPDVVDVSNIGAPPPNPFAIDPKSFDTSASLAEKATQRDRDGRLDFKAVRDYKHALKQSEAYYQLAHDVATHHHEASRNVAAGNILSGIADLSPNDPQYEQKVSGAIRDNMEGIDHPAVQNVLQTKHAARQVQLGALAQGGGSEFTEGSAGARAFKKTMHTSGGDLAHSVGAGRAADISHKQLEALVAAGALSKEEMPDIVPGKPLPTVTLADGTKFSPYNADHELNYPGLIDLGNRKIGQRQEKANAQMNSDERNLREQAGYYQKALGQMDTSDANYGPTQQVYNDIHSKLLTYDQARVAQPVPGAGKKAVQKRKARRSSDYYAGIIAGLTPKE